MLSFDRTLKAVLTPTIWPHDRGRERVDNRKGDIVTLCPIALAVHCVGCPIVKMCPAKTTIGDYGKYVPPTTKGKE